MIPCCFPKPSFKISISLISFSWWNVLKCDSLGED
jgi:hypothetical protein